MDYLSYHATKRLPEVTDCPFRRPSMLHCQRQQRAVVIQQQGPERLAPFLPYSGMVAAPLYAAAVSWQHCSNAPGKTHHDDSCTCSLGFDGLCDAWYPLGTPSCVAHVGYADSAGFCMVMQDLLLEKSPHVREAASNRPSGRIQYRHVRRQLQLARTAVVVAQRRCIRETRYDKPG